MNNKSRTPLIITTIVVNFCMVGLAFAQLPPEPRILIEGKNIRGLGNIRINGRNVPLIQGVEIFGVGANNQRVGTNQTASNPVAILKTDPELEAILEKADRFRDEKQYGIASKLWQSVLERSGDSLFSSDGQIYFSLSQQVEQILADLPVDAGLGAYRITADANAKEIMAVAEDPFDERALQQVVRRFFLSSLGDNAALTLSSIYMDKHDFVGAYRMLEKIANGYPDPSVHLVDVHTRMAVCQAMMGEENNAMVAIGKAKDLADGVDRKIAQDVEKSISSMVLQKFDRRVGGAYTMALAHRDRSGVMPSLSSRILSRDLQAEWQYYYNPRAARWSDISRVKPLFGEDVLGRAEDSVTQKERIMIESWRKQGWRPSGDLLFDGPNVFFKTSVDLTVWNRLADSDKVVWRPLWRNRYEMDDFSKSMIEIRRRMRRGRMGNQESQSHPDELFEIQLFSDRIAAQMSVQDGVLYTIEGQRFDVATAQSNPRSNPRFNINLRRSRANQLTAYDAKTGRLQWTLPPINSSDSENSEFGDEFAEEQPWIQSGGFMSAPLHYGGLLIVPVNHGGSISVYALDPEQNGKTIWKSFLCDEPNTGANPYAPVNLSIDGSDLFASCGLGVVFIIDPTTGLIRFAKRYERAENLQVHTGRWGRGIQQMAYESWSSDTILAYGRQMICFSSDAKNIEAIDRNSGKLVWRGTAQPLEAKVDYLLGVFDGILYAAGPETVLAFSLDQEGRMVWGGKKMFGGKTSYGRGMLTSDGIYMPVEDQIIKFNLAGKNGEPVRLGTADVELGTGAPVGNLFSDGKKIWVQGANRVYALGPVKKKKK